MSPRCSDSVLQNYRTSPCSRKGTVERDGKWYCRQHDPVAKKARDDASYAKYKAESEKRAEYHHRAEMFTELVGALKALLPFVDGLDPLTLERYEDLIAKAEGGLHG